jgi:hypothetical protein
MIVESGGAVPERFNTSHLKPEPIDIAELDALRTKMLHCVRQASDSLSWFAQQVASGGIPFNIWRRFDRPLSRHAKTAGLAFEVWHAMLRAERTLRLWAPDRAEQLRQAACDLKTKLEKSLDELAKDDVHIYARRLVSDEIFGTLNALSAASVLRSEVFPQRATSTPSYLAGHILISELKSARNEARAHSISGIRERSPRLFVVAQGVHSLMLYVEQLRKRVTCFTDLAIELESIRKISDVIAPVKEHHPEEEALVTDGYLRIAAARLASVCGECDALVLATRPFFREWCKSLGRLSSETASVAMPQFNSAFKSALAGLARSYDAECHEPQMRAFRRAIGFCNDHWLRVSQVHTALKEAFGVAPDAGCVELMRDIEKLKNSLEKLEELHLGDTKPGEFPSILDAARFQFAKMLVSHFCDDNGVLLSLEVDCAQRRLTENLNHLRRVYEPFSHGTPSATQSDACQIVRALGDSPVGRGVLEWWSNYAQCYACPAADQYNKGTEKFPDRDSAWFSLRHRSFFAIEALTRKISECGDWSELIEPLRCAAREEQAIADSLEKLIKDLTQWCSARGHQLVLLGRNGKSQIADPLELVAALWIADRIGEPWEEKLEQDAFEVVSSLQHPDGSFGAVAPLYHNRGFTFYLPSASTIALLARFAIGGTDAPRRRPLQDRLRRWAPVLLRGALFLTESGVGVDGDRGEGRSHQSFAGWHSDRHPEAERIDCFATTEAITALCRLDDAFRWLINLEVTQEFRISWPSRILKDALPTDVESFGNQLLLRVAPLARELKLLSASYSGSLDVPLGRGVGRRSFLFHGPPGTGKTYSQEIIAGELGWPLITLTIGDFLHDGEDKVGRRAEDIFRRLSYLSHVCIVFDEFDEMVTARARVNQVGWSGLPLLTATMLPLLSGLRDKSKTRCCTISFTTNYLENIDRAATRVGRVDELILLTYPDYSSRILLGVRAAARCACDAAPVDWDLIRNLASETALCAYPDVRAHIESGIAGRAAAARARPKSPVDSSYYSGGDDIRPDALHAVAELLKTVGPPDVLAAWLKRPENLDWEHLYIRDQQRGSSEFPERRNHERYLVRSRCKAQIDGREFTLVDVSECGFRLDVPAGQQGFSSAEPLSIYIGVSSWPGFTQPNLTVAATAVHIPECDAQGDQCCLCCKVEQTSIPSWKNFVTELSRHGFIS